MPSETSDEVKERIARRLADDAAKDGVARRIAEIRDGRGLTQDAVSAKYGTTLTNYQRFEDGTRDIKLTTLFRIAAALGVPVSELFVPPTKPKPPPGRPRKS